ncbi:hypothetical protein ABT390_25325 [Streptomyces aurantiacus]|uniref:Uncharacterized protein n=1 Tax=Streptomyces aurantiacus JA 4570 TaxID=1286094 RepID=S3ZVH3_9ACTN|nr:hypothetical protein [Streptomyces aurantiacus]EPH46779.1 hypothetical protein STRAU_0192 [Streptomyces aurantiacus JA 4570]
MTEAECREVLARAWAGRLAVARRGRPYVELVSLVVSDGAPVALVPDAGPVARALPPVVAPRQWVVLEADDAQDMDGAHRAVRAVTALGRPRWLVATDEVGACRRAASARGLDVAPDIGFLTLTGPVLSGERHLLRCGPGQEPLASEAPVRDDGTTAAPPTGVGARDGVGAHQESTGLHRRGGPRRGIASRMRPRSSPRGPG